MAGGVIDEEHKDNADLWKLLILDGYGSHTMEPEALQLLLDHKIHAITIPAHTSSHLQVADVCVFGPMKKALRRLSTEHMERNPSAPLDRWDFPEVMWAALQTVSAESIRAGFRKTGIEPLNMRWVEENAEALTISETFHDVNKASAARSAAFGDTSLEFNTNKTLFQFIVDQEGWAQLPQEDAVKLVDRLGLMASAVRGECASYLPASRAAVSSLSLDIEDGGRQNVKRLGEIYRDGARHRNALLESRSSARLLTIPERISAILEHQSKVREAAIQANRSRKNKEEDRARKAEEIRNRAQRSSENQDIIDQMKVHLPDITAVTVVTMTTYLKAEGAWTQLLEWLRREDKRRSKDTMVEFVRLRLDGRLGDLGALAALQTDETEEDRQAQIAADAGETTSGNLDEHVPAAQQVGTSESICGESVTTSSAAGNDDISAEGRVVEVSGAPEPGLGASSNARRTIITLKLRRS